MAWFIWFVWCCDEPCSGKSETISYLPEPTTFWQVEVLTGVALPPPPPFPPLEPLLLLLPQPAATSIATRTMNSPATSPRLRTDLIKNASMLG